MQQENIKVTGELRLILTDEHGNVKLDQTHKNLVVTAGKKVIADRMKGTPTLGAMTHMAVGTGQTAPTIGDTALGTQAGTRATVSTNVVDTVITYSATFIAGQGTGALTEAGIFNASSGGDMLCRTVFSVVNKGDGDTLSVNWNVTIN